MELERVECRWMLRMELESRLLSLWLASGLISWNSFHSSCRTKKGLQDISLSRGERAEWTSLRRIGRSQTPRGEAEKGGVRSGMRELIVFGEMCRDVSIWLRRVPEEEGGMRDACFLPLMW